MNITAEAQRTQRKSHAAVILEAWMIEGELDPQSVFLRAMSNVSSCDLRALRASAVKSPCFQSA
jgi:hypothetical protein